MHEFIITLDKMHKENGVTATDIAKAMLDEGIHPPTMYFPLIVPEDLMVEPTETALDDPAHMHELPVNTVIRRPDEVKAAREPVIRYSFDK